MDTSIHEVSVRLKDATSDTCVLYRLTDECPIYSALTQHMSLRSMYRVTAVAS